MMPNLELLSSPQPPPPTPSCNNGDVPVRENRKKEAVRVKQEIVKSEDEGDQPDKTESISQFNLAEHRFSFEQIPRSEPWYEPFSRQDQGVEFYTCFSDSGYWKPFLLPYQMNPPPPPLDPKICISAYAEAKKQIMCELSSGTTSASCSTHDDQSSSDVYTPDVFEETSRTSEDSSYMEIVEEQRSKPRRSRAPPPVKSPTSKNPRKSPRQHASTLAILSSLIHQRKRRERSRNKTSERTLEAIPEVDLMDDARENSVEREAKSIDDLLNGALEDFHTQEKLDIRCKKVNLLATDTPVDPIEILESYKNVEEKPAGQNPSRRSVPGKKPGRKKRNRTGWPNKNHRRIKKETVADDVESTVDVLSVFSDPDDEESRDSKVLNGPNGLGAPNLNNFSGQIGQLVNKPDQSKDASVNNVQNSDDRVIGSDNCRSDRVVDLDRWENAEKVLAAKINVCNTDLQFQPYVKVQKLDEDGIKTVNRRLRNSSPPPISSAKRRRRMPASPKSPRELRKPRGRWYRER